MKKKFIFGLLCKKKIKNSDFVKIKKFNRTNDTRIERGGEIEYYKTCLQAFRPIIINTVTNKQLPLWKLGRKMGCGTEITEPRKPGWSRQKIQKIWRMVALWNKEHLTVKEEARHGAAEKPLKQEDVIRVAEEAAEVAAAAEVSVAWSVSWAKRCIHWWAALDAVANLLAKATQAGKHAPSNCFIRVSQESSRCQVAASGGEKRLQMFTLAACLAWRWSKKSATFFMETELFFSLLKQTNEIKEINLWESTCLKVRCSPVTWPSNRPGTV